MNDTAAITTGKSRLSSACTVRRPSPGQAKIVSVMTAPPRSWPASSPASVTIGIAELRSVCLPITRPSPSPLARAVLMNSSLSTSSMAERVSRATRAAKKAASTTDGMIRWATVPVPPVGSQRSCTAKT